MCNILPAGDCDRENLTHPVNEEMKEVPHLELQTQEDIDTCVLTYKHFAELDGKGLFHPFGLSPKIRAYFTLKFG